MQDPHIADADLVQSADGELPAGREREVRAHLAGCWTCRARLRELERAIADFVELRQESLQPPLPPPEGPLALLKLRLAESAAGRGSDPRPRQILMVLAACAIVVVAAGVLMQRLPVGGSEPDRPVRSEGQAIPNPDLTPGVAAHVTKDDLCAAGATEAVRIVPAPVAQRVFAAYGIERPQPRAYEVDYLISPALGGSDHIRNFWPQPYGSTVWNAHIKDALEDRLYQMVCGGGLELEAAQRDIARDWIAAYKKYFHTDRPLPEHAAFLKDRPWE